uniref:Ig-like domain-containing protein n=1 Tax=Takifugu rubripes TaxID=31033 RepID=A0A674NMW3_TAKRU
CSYRGCSKPLNHDLSSDTNFILVKPGQNLTLPCLQKDNVSPMIYWFKQTLGEKPRLICTHRISSEDWKFVNDFKTNPRFQLHPGNKGANLTISDLELSDSATYYCANQYLNVVDFTEGYKVIVEGSGLTIDQSASQSIQAGGSVTLNCTVHTGWICDWDHTVYWFRNSGPSQLGLMYSHTGRNKQCERKTNTCFYNFSMKNLKTSQTGTYYCAVAACGHILFGNGTKLVFEEGSGLTIDQSASHSIQAEGSVTLNCAVHTGWTCDGDHTVYWFRNSGPPQLGLMYSHTGRNKQCERETNTCFYSFSMKNLNTSQTGTYYCAVAACGHILFGNGPKMVCGGECSNFVFKNIKPASSTLFYCP